MMRTILTLLLLPIGLLQATEPASLILTRTTKSTLKDVNGRKAGSVSLERGKQFDVITSEGSAYLVQVGPYTAKVPKKYADTGMRTEESSKQQSGWFKRRPAMQSAGAAAVGSLNNTSSRGYEIVTGRGSGWRDVSSAYQPSPQIRSNVSSSFRKIPGVAGPWQNVGSRVRAAVQAEPLEPLGMIHTLQPSVMHSSRSHAMAGPWRKVGEREVAPLPDEPVDPTSWRAVGSTTEPLTPPSVGISPYPTAPDGEIERSEPLPRDVIEKNGFRPTGTSHVSQDTPASSTTAVTPNAPHPGTTLKRPADKHQNPMLPTNLVDRNGRPIPSSSLDGKMIGFYFTASWCGPCKAFTPPLVKFRDHYGDRMEIVMVGSDRTPQEHFAYMKEYKIPFPATEHGSFATRFLYERYDIGSVPSLVVVRPDGFTLTTDGRAELLKDPDEAFDNWFARCQY